MQMIIASEGSQERKQTHQEIRSESKTDERMKQQCPTALIFILYQIFTSSTLNRGCWMKQTHSLYHSLHSYNFGQIWSMTVLDKETELTQHPNKQLLKFGLSIQNHLSFKYIYLKVRRVDFEQRKLQLINSICISLYCELQPQRIQIYSSDFHACTSLCSLLRTCCLP